MQVNAYNDFIDNRSNGVSFAGFIDVDEFLCLKADSSLEQFLLRYIDCYGFCVNWKLFGDNGIPDVVDNDWSVIKRFTKCQCTMNKHVKTFLNIGRCGKAFHFVNPHCVDASLRFNCIVDPSKQVFVHGPWNEKSSNAIAQLNHYHCKTLGEYRLKNMRGRADMHNMTID